LNFTSALLERVPRGRNCWSLFSYGVKQEDGARSLPWQLVADRVLQQRLSPELFLSRKLACCLKGSEDVTASLLYYVLECLTYTDCPSGNPVFVSS